MADMEIRVHSKQTGGGLQSTERDVKAVTTALDKAAKDRDVKVKVDDSQVKRLDKDMRDLDSIPPPHIEPKVDAVPAKEAMEDTMAQVDLGDMAGSMTSQIGGALSAAGPIGAVVGAAALVWGDDLAAGLTAGFTAKRTRMREQIEFGLSDLQMDKAGRAAGEAWTAGFGEGLADVRHTALILENTLGTVDDNLRLDKATKSAEALAEVYGVELPQSADLARRMVANNLAPDTQAAFKIMAESAQTYRLDSEEILEVMSEFSPVFGKMRVDGAQAMHIIGETVKRGLLPNVDRAAELFEEFNIRVTEGILAEQFTEIGLSAELMQQKMADGRGAEAMAEVADALLAVGSEADRNRLAIEIFGTSIESAGDKAAVLDLLSMADDTRAYTSALADAEKVVEDSVTGFDRLTVGVTQLGTQMGKNADGSVSALLTVHDKMADGLNFGLGPALGFLESKFKDSTAAVDLSEEAVNRSRAAFERASAGADDYGNAAGDLAGELDETAAAQEELSAALTEFGDRFASDRVFRSIGDDVDALRAATEELTGANVNLAGEFDESTDAGQRAAETAERLSGNLDVLIAGYDDGSLSAGDFNRGQAEVEEGLRGVAAELGLTKTQTERLIEKYGEVPDEISTKADMEAIKAMAAVDRMQTAMNNLNGRKARTHTQHDIITNRTTVYRTFGTPRAHGGVTGAAAAGGVQANDLTLVGEDGPELVELAAGSSVSTAGDTSRKLGAGGEFSGGGGDRPVTVIVQGDMHTDRSIVELIREELQNGSLD